MHSIAKLWTPSICVTSSWLQCISGRDILYELEASIRIADVVLAALGRGVGDLVRKR
jgi:hypothetical protein